MIKETTLGKNKVSAQEEELVIDYTPYFELGTWQLSEAVCIFFRTPLYDASGSPNYPAILIYQEAIYIQDVLNRACRDGRLKNAEWRGGSVSGTFVAPYLSWLEFAQSLQSIDVDPNLFEQAGLTNVKGIRRRDSYRPEEEITLKTVYCAIAKTIFGLWPKVRSKDILESQPIQDLFINDVPTDRTLTKWRKEAGIELYDQKQKRSEIDEMRQNFPSLWPTDKEISQKNVQNIIKDG
jgi:hypothetical protein